MKITSNNQVKVDDDMQTHNRPDRAMSQGNRLAQIMRPANCFMVLGFLMALLASGCKTMDASKWDPPPQYRTADLTGKKIVVSDFTVSSDLGLMSFPREDISLDMAEQFKEAGVPVRVMPGATPAQLQTNELLLTGHAKIEQMIPRAEDRRPTTLAVCTLGLVGFILPTPIPFRVGCHVRYDIRLVDPSGKVVLVSTLTQPRSDPRTKFGADAIGAPRNSTRDDPGEYFGADAIFRKIYIVWGAFSPPDVKEFAHHTIPKVLVEPLVQSSNM